MTPAARGKVKHQTAAPFSPLKAVLRRMAKIKIFPLCQQLLRNPVSARTRRLRWQVPSRKGEEGRAKRESVHAAIADSKCGDPARSKKKTKKRVINR